MQQHWRGSGAAGNSTNWRQGCQQQPSRDSRQQEVLSFCLQLHFGSSANHCVVLENINGRFKLEDLHVAKRGNIKIAIKEIGARGSLMVMALRYKPAGRGFDSRWCHWNFSVT